MEFCKRVLQLLLLLHLAPQYIADVATNEADMRYFYIHDWPDYFKDVWPPMNYPLDPAAPYSHNFRGNNGAGELVDKKLGYFNTWQFGMFQMVFARLRASEHRTLDPTKASAFIIPWDIGVHSFIDHVNGRTRVAAPHGWRAIEYMKEIVKNEVFWKHGGHDHFVLDAITSYQIIGIGAKVFLCTICQNCSVLTIETTPTFTARKYYANKSKKYWYAVPYPSAFHYYEGIEILPWSRKSWLGARQYLSLFIGSVETSTPKSNILRRKMQSQCKSAGSNCLWFDAAHSCSGVVNQSRAMLLYRDSIFCLAPPGDSLTRKSLFDSFSAGCIPVVFIKGSITQYFWHIPPEMVNEVIVFIPGQSIINGSVNFFEFLRTIPSEEIDRKQRIIERIAPSLQYSVVPDGYGASPEEVQRLYSLSQTGVAPTKGSPYEHVKPGEIEYKGPIWKPKFPDAVDIIINRILNRSTIEPIQGFTDEEVAHFGKLRDIAEKIDPEFAGFGVRPIGRINKRGSHRNKVSKHAADHKRDTFEYLGDEVK